MSRITAVVVAFESAHVLPACLDALSREGVPAIVVDNASSDDTGAVARRHGARVVRNAANQGYGRANNIGVRAASADFVLIVNPDLVLEPGAAERLLEAAESFPDAAILAPRILEPDGRFFFAEKPSLLAPTTASAGLRESPSGDCCAPFLSGACLMVRRDLFLRLGGFDERIFLYYEDDDLCRRMRDAGHALVHVHAAVARHGRGRSAELTPALAFNLRWHQAWSRAYVARKYGLPDPAPGHLAQNALKAGLALLTGRPDLMARYRGSAAGALAFLRGDTALSRQGLDEPERETRAA